MADVALVGVLRQSRGRHGMIERETSGAVGPSWSWLSCFFLFSWFTSFLRMFMSDRRWTSSTFASEWRIAGRNVMLVYDVHLSAKRVEPSVELVVAIYVR